MSRIFYLTIKKLYYLYKIVVQLEITAFSTELSLFINFDDNINDTDLIDFPMYMPSIHTVTKHTEKIHGEIIVDFSAKPELFPGFRAHLHSQG